MELERAILDLLDERAPKTICPSDVARKVGPPDGWRALLQPVPDAAAKLVARGEVEVTQQGERASGSTSRRCAARSRSEAER